MDNENVLVVKMLSTAWSEGRVASEREKAAHEEGEKVGN